MEPELKKIDPRDLYPNSYNPNHLGAANFKRLHSTLKLSGINETPIVVRPGENGSYEIVDGEHTWRAAFQLNLPKVLCEIRGYDDFEARVQTVVRNIHGTPDIVKMGRLLLDMQENGEGIAERELSDALGMSRSTVQRRLIYGRLSQKRETEIADKGISDIPSDVDLSKLKYDDAKALWEHGVVPEQNLAMPASAERFLKHFINYPDDTKEAVLKHIKKQVSK